MFCYYGQSKTTDSNGNAIFYDVPSDTAMIYTVNAEGYQSHSVDITVVDDMSKTVILQSEDQTTDIANNSVEISVYPNPASEYLLINNINQTEISIYNTNGKQVYLGQSNSSTQKVDISKFRSGTYFLIINRSNQTIESKVFIVK